ncbi:Tn3 family transposase [Streptomyces sp. NPDC002403]
MADNDPAEQEKAMKFNALLTNAVICHNAPDIAELVRQLLGEGWEIAPEALAHISPYLTEHISRFGEYSTHELGIQPEAYGPSLDVDFTPLRDRNPGLDRLRPRHRTRPRPGRHRESHGREARAH